MTAALRVLLLVLLTLGADPALARSYRELQADEQFGHGNYQLARALYREALRGEPRNDRLWAKYDLANVREMATETTVQTAATVALTTAALQGHAGVSVVGAPMAVVSQLVPPTHARSADRASKRTRLSQEQRLARATRARARRNEEGLGNGPAGTRLASSLSRPRAARRGAHKMINMNTSIAARSLGLTVPLGAPMSPDRPRPQPVALAKPAATPSRAVAPEGAPIASVSSGASATPQQIAALEPAFDRDAPAESVDSGTNAQPRIPGTAAVPAKDAAAAQAEAEGRARAAAAEQARVLATEAQRTTQITQAAQAAELVRLTSPSDAERIPGGQAAAQRTPGGASEARMPGGQSSRDSRIAGGQPERETRIPGGQPQSQLSAATQSAVAQGLVPESTQVSAQGLAGPAATPGQPDGTTVLAPNEIIPVAPNALGDPLTPSVGTRGEPLVVRGTGWDVWDLRYAIDLAGRPHVVGKLRNLSGVDIVNPTVYLALIDPAGVQIAFKPVKLTDPSGVLFPNASGEFDAEFPSLNSMVAGYRLYVLPQQ